MVIKISYVDKNIKIITGKNRLFNTFDLIKSFIINKKKSSAENKLDQEINQNESTINETEIKETQDFNENEVLTENLNEDSLKENIPEESLENVNDETKDSETSSTENNTSSSKTKSYLVDTLEDIKNATLESFLNEITTNTEFLKQFQEFKPEKKFLVLPDELLGFDTITIPSLNPWKVKENLKLKMCATFNDISRLNISYKAVNKIKPNSIYAIQFIKEKTLSSILDSFRKNGFKFKGVNFYSSCLSDFYSSHINLSKNGTVIIKVNKKHTTIIAISHGFLILTTTLACGEADLLNNIEYKYDNFSKKMIGYKYLCHELSKINSHNNTPTNKDITLDQIDSFYNKNKNNLPSTDYKPRRSSVIDAIKGKVSEVISFLNKSDMKIKVDRIFIDTHKKEIFNSLDIDNSIHINFYDRQIFETFKQNSLLKFNKINNLSNNKNNNKKNKKKKGGLWKKTTSEE